MKAKLQIHGQCGECKSLLMTSDCEAIFCSNPDCPHYGKKFAYPEVELEECE